jgi:dipeptidyl aminopeptidase/acylaminoacyl peptidase
MSYLAIVVKLLGVTVTIVTGFRGLAFASSPLTSVPITALPGLEVAPTFSPDVTQIAFAWSDPASGSKGFDLYSKVVGSENMVRLTHHPSQWITPAWSPDGTQIAFHRNSGTDTGLYLVPALGGPERKLQSTNIDYELAAQISWSADGKWIAYVDSIPNTVKLLSVESLENKRLPHTPDCVQAGMPAFSHHGNHRWTRSIAISWSSIISASQYSPVEGDVCFEFLGFSC